MNIEKLTQVVTGSAVVMAFMAFAPAGLAADQAPRTMMQPNQSIKLCCESCVRNADLGSAQGDKKNASAAKHQETEREESYISPALDTKPGGLAWPGF